MKTRPIYIKSLELENVRTFGDKVLLEFETKDGILPQWTLILGDNGIGKSTLLQSIAWMKPHLPDFKDEKNKKINRKDIQPYINDEENETLKQLVRKNTEGQNEPSKIKAKFLANKTLDKRSLLKAEKYCVSSIEIKVDKNRKLDDVKIDFKTNAEEVFYYDEIVIYSYSASRNLGNQNIEDPELDDTIPGFIAERTTLYDAFEILHTINYAAFGSLKKEKHKYKKYIERVKDMLVSILPDFENISDVEISAPKIEDNKVKPGEIYITTKHGKKLSFDNFSLGYKTVIGWTVDLSWRLFNKYSKSTNPLHEPAIVLIDEVDLHLHPIWQREIMNNLSKHFPKVQFIATAHSPLMVQAALGSNHAVLKYNEGGVEIENNPKSVDGWRVDQILTSDFFGLKTSRGIEYENLIDGRQKLINKKILSRKEKEDLKKINQQLSEFPIGENPEEMENRKLISSIVAKIKGSNTKIEL